MTGAGHTGGMSDDNVLRAALRLHLSAGVGPLTFWKLVEAFGGVVEAASAGPGQWGRVSGVGPKTLEGLLAVTDEAIQEELDLAAGQGVRIITAFDASYPAPLINFPDRPPLLYVRGRFERSDAVALAVVGSRRCTHYGLEQAHRFGGLLGRAGLTVISGGARGIDTAAHRGALEAGGRTIAVMGCGLSQTYPSENAELFERIVADGRGLLVSELPMRTAVLGGNFPTRNRIISGLSLGVLVVEAARKSGSLITAREAAEQGREVFALPGRVDSPLSSGANQLIRDGAILVQDLDDILEHLGEVGAKLSAEESPAGVALPAGLTPTEQALAGALAEGPLSLDELLRRTKLDSGPAMAAMTMLVLKGAVAQQPGNMFARKGQAPAKA